MRPIIQKNGQPEYGVLDEPIRFNHEDFILRNFFGKPVGGIRKKLAYHAFNFLGVLSQEHIAGVAVVNLGYMHALFAYVYSFSQGMLFSWETKGPGLGRLLFPANPDEYEILWEKGKNRVHIEKSHASGRLEADIRLGGRFALRLSAPYSLAGNQPLRVLNPSEPFRWTFTEKGMPILPQELSMTLDGRTLEGPENATILYDWSGGYLRRQTNWFWAAFSGVQEGKLPVGANFAALTNETYFSENAFWVNNRRTRVPRVIFTFDYDDPFRPWTVRDEEGLVDLTFHPAGERSEKINALVIKTYFRQFFGHFEGVLRPPEADPVEISGVRGFTEFHRALW
ncbi:MAG: DUF2804 domain-containing protein [Proteobacteria bacterium]|nr:DUF2804 domain-containing protein [Pseudomonadota bacterium]